jgi:peptidoglycan/LPS O-acetylase OafA/YrhL
MSTVAERIPFLDGLRGISALAIVLTHQSILWERNYPNIANLLVKEKYFVIIFFFLSGFSICVNIASTKHFSYIRYIIRRFNKIAPLYYFILLIGLLINGSTIRSFPIPDIIAHLTFTNFDFISPAWQWDILSVEWTMPILMFYYLFIPPLFFLGKRNPILLFPVTIASALLFTNQWIFSSLYKLNPVHFERVSLQYYAFTYGLAISTYWLCNNLNNYPRMTVTTKYMYLLAFFIICLCFITQAPQEIILPILLLFWFYGYAVFLKPRITHLGLHPEILSIVEIISLFCLALYWVFFNLKTPALFMTIGTSVFVTTQITQKSKIVSLLCENKIILWVSKISYALFLSHVLVLRIIMKAVPPTTSLLFVSFIHIMFSLFVSFVVTAIFTTKSKRILSFISHTIQYQRKVNI